MNTNTQHSAAGRFSRFFQTLGNLAAVFPSLGKATGRKKSPLSRADPGADEGLGKPAAISPGGKKSPLSRADPRAADPRAALAASITAALLLSFSAFNAQAEIILGWSFSGTAAITSQGANDVVNANLDTGGSFNNLTRGAGAGTSSGGSSFRTTGFQNNGIAVGNTDYFQFILSAASGYTLSLSGISGSFVGTTTYSVSPGVSQQWAYSTDGTTFTLIGSSVARIGNGTSSFDFSGVSALQNVVAGTDITLRYYATGQTSTGGWGFDSAGFDVNGTLASACSPGAVTITENVASYDAKWTVNSGTGDAYDSGATMGMWANGDAAFVAAWKTTRVSSATSGAMRKLQVGDEFTICVGTYGVYYGQLGVSLNRGGAVNSWNNRTNGMQASVRQDGGNFGSGGGIGSWYVSDSGSESFTNTPSGSSSADYTVKIRITSSSSFNVDLNGKTKYDRSFLGSPGVNDRIDAYSVFLSDDRSKIWSDYFRRDSIWKQTTMITNLGYVEFGGDNGTRDILGRIEDGNNPTCTNTVSPIRVRKTGTGIVTLQYTGNTYSAGTAIEAGTLAVYDDRNLGTVPGVASNNIEIWNTGTLRITNSFTISANRQIQLGNVNGPRISVDANKTGTYAGVMGGTANWTNMGLGVLALTGTANTNAGHVTIQYGTLRISGDGSLGVVPGSAAEKINIWSSGQLEANATFTLNAYRGIGLGDVNGPKISVASGFTLTYGGALTGAANWSKESAGQLTLTATESNTGSLTINGNSVVRIQHANALGGTGAGTTVSSGSALEIQGTITTAAEPLTLNGSGISSGGALRNTANNNTYAGAITQGSASRINADSGTTLTLDVASGNAIAGTYNLTLGGVGNITVNDPIAISTGTLTKDGAGTLTLAGVNTHSGNTTVSAGTMVITGTSGSSAHSVSANATLMGAGTVGNLTANGYITPGNTASAVATLNCGTLTLGAGGSNRVDMTSAVGAAGTGYDLINCSGAIAVNGSGTFTMYLSGSPGDFVNTTDYSWTIMNGSSVSGFDSNRFAIVSTAFTPGLGGGAFTVSQSASGDIMLNFISLKTPPSTPTGLTASDGTSAAQVALSWNNVANELGYVIFRNTVNTFASAARIYTNATDALTYNDTGATPGQLYYYWVTATNAGGSSAESTSDSGYRKMATVASVAATDGSDLTQVVVTWGNITGETGFGIWRHTADASGSATCIGSVAADTLTYNDTTATQGQKYYYWVRATNSTSSSMSDFSSSNDGYRKMATVASVAATDGTDLTKVTVTWGNITGETGFGIWRYTADVSGSAACIGSVAADTLTYDDTTATQGTKYWYWVRATNSTSASMSDFSSSNDGYRKLATVTGVAATDCTALNKVTVTWADITGETGYGIWRYTSDVSGSSTLIGNVAADTLTYDDSTAAIGQTYYYWVRGSNNTSSGTGDFSASDSGSARIAPPTALYANPTNSADFTAQWTGSTGATNYYLDVSTNESFAGSGGGGIATNCEHQGTLGGGTGGSWTETDVVQSGSGGTAYIGMSAATAQIITPALDLRGVIGAGVCFSGATFGTISAPKHDITVHVSTNNGTDWILLGSSRPTSSTLTRYEYDISTYTTSAQVKVRLTSTSASGTQYPRLDGVMVTSLTSAAGSYVAGYSNRSVNASSLSVTGLQVFTAYYYRLRAEGTNTCLSGNSSTGSVTTVAGAPAAPTGLTASDGSSEAQVALSWNDVAGETGYVVFRNTVNTFASAARIYTNAAGTVTYNDTGATPGLLYYYWVTATNGAGSSAESTSDSGYRKLAAPGNVAATDGSSTANVTITWDAVTGATSYKIFRDTDSNPVGATDLGAQSSGYADTTATPGQLYYYWVKAYASSSSSESDYSTYNTGYRKLSAPGNVAATDGSSTANVTITWDAVTGATSYKIFRDTDSDPTGATDLGTQSSGYADTTATPGQLYYYWVKAYASSSSSESDYSTSNTGYRKLATVASVAATDCTALNKVTVTWADITGETGYGIWRHTADVSGSATLIGNVAAGTVTYDDSSAAIGQTYYYWVRGSNSTSASMSDFNSSDSGSARIAPPTALYANPTNSADFTALWTGSTGATNYYLDVATSSGFTSGTTTNISENFAGFTTTNGSSDISGSLDTYMQTAGWAGAAVYMNGGESKLGGAATRGILTTPALNLSANGGQASLVFDSRSWVGDASVLQIYVATDGVNFTQSDGNITLTESMVTYTNAITNGTSSCKVRFYGLNSSSERFYLNDVRITQGGASTYVSGYENRSVNATSLSVTGLTGGTAYYYRLRAEGTNTCMSGNSSTQTVTTVVPAVFATAWFQGFEGTTNDALSYVATPGTGTVRPDKKYDNNKTGLYTLMLAGSINGAADPYLVFDNLDLSGYSSATVSVGFACSGADADDNLHLDLSYDNGSTWGYTTQLIDGLSSFEIDFGATDAARTATMNPLRIGIPASSNQVRVRIRLDESVGNDNTSDEFFIDDLKVTGVGTVPTIWFGTNEQTVLEDAGTVTIPVKISSAASATVQVYIAGNAAAGGDYTANSTSIVFAAGGATTSNLVLTITDDDTVEGPEVARFRLVRALGARIAGPDESAAFIRDGDSISIMSANLSGGTGAWKSVRPVDAEAQRILRQLKPDVVSMQEWNCPSGQTYRAFVDANFGTNFYYVLDNDTADLSIPNGIVSRWNITVTTEWTSVIGYRDPLYAKIDIPGTRNLHVVSVHFAADPGGGADRISDATSLTNDIAGLGIPVGDYLVIAGDLNLSNRTDSCLQILTNLLVTDAHKPADKNGDEDSNVSGTMPYDLVLPSTNLDEQMVSYTFNGTAYANGMIFDSRLWSYHDYPSLAGDSATTNFAHRPVMKVFGIGISVEPPAAFTTTATNPTQIELAFTRNAKSEDVVIVYDEDNTFTDPSGAPPAVGGALAGGTVVYKGGTSPQSHTSLASCKTYYYRCWAFTNTTFSTGVGGTNTTPAILAPTALYADPTNAINFTAKWTGSAGATNYYLDVSTSSGFGGVGTVAFQGFEGTGSDTWLFSTSATAVAINTTTSQTGTASLQLTAAAGTALFTNMAMAAGSATVSVCIAASGPDTDEDLFMDISYDQGATWASTQMVDGFGNLALSFGQVTAARTLNGNPFLYSLTPGATQVMIRVRVNAISASEYYYVDNVRVDGPAGSYVPGYEARGTAASSLSVTGLSQSTTYYYRLRAEGTNACQSGYSVTGTVTTIVGTPQIVLADNGAQVTAGSVAAGVTAHILLQFQFSVTEANATLTNLTFTSAGTYDANDLTNFKLRYSTDASLDAGDATLGTIASPAVAGLKTFAALSQAVNAGYTGYFFITADLDAAATAGNTLSANALATTNTLFSSGSKSGSTTAGGAQTIVVSEPTTHASALAFSNVQMNQMTVNWVNGDGANRIVVIHAGTATSWAPSDGTAPSGVNTNFSSATDQGSGNKICYDGSGTNVTITGLTAGTTYYVAIYEYNGSGVSVNYYTGGTPLNGSQDTFCTAAPAGLFAKLTNAANFTAVWNAAAGATGYRLDVSLYNTFQVGAGSGTITNEDFSTLTDTVHPAGWTGSRSADLDYVSAPTYGAASPAYKFQTAAQWLLSPTFASGATNLRFWAYGNGSGTASILTISGLVNSVWTSIRTVSVPANSSTTTNVALSAGTTQISFSFTKNGYNVALDDVLIAGAGTVPSYVPGYSNLTVSGTTTQLVEGLSSGEIYYFRVRSAAGSCQSGNSSTATVTTIVGASSVTLADNGTQVAVGNVYAGTAKHLLHQFQLSVAAANATLTGVGFTSGGTYSESDITRFEVWYSADSALDTGADTLLGMLDSALGPGPHALSGLSKVINVNTTGYVFVTADIAASPTYGRTISLNAIVTDDLTFADANKSGSTTAGGAQTIVATEPTTHASNLRFTDVGMDQMTLTWTNGNGEKRIVVVKSGSATSWGPTDGTAPDGVTANFTATTNMGGGNMICYDGTGSSFTLSNLTAETAYYVTIFEYNGSGGYVDYYTNGAPLSGAAATICVSVPAGLYASPTNSTDFTANWSAAAGAASYRLDVSTNAQFDAVGVLSTNFVRFDFPATASLVPSVAAGVVTSSIMSLSSGEVIETNVTTGTYFSNEPYVEESGGWASNSQATAKYFVFTVYPVGGKSITVTGISFRAYATAAGPSAFSCDVDSGASTYTVNAPDASIVSVNQSVTNVVGKTGAVVVKIQGWDNGSRTTGGSGAFRLDSVQVFGTIAGGGGAYYVPGFSNLTVAGTSQSVTGLVAERTYYYRVRAVSAGACASGNSSTGTVTTYVALASEPTQQANTIAFSSVYDESMTVSWSGGNGANSLVIARQGSAPSGVPIDRASYTADANFSGSGSSLGEGQVVYIGSAASFSLSGLTTGTTYHLRVFEYNGSGATANYLTNSATGNPNSQATTAPVGAPTFEALAETPEFIRLNGAKGSGSEQLLVVHRSGAATTADPANGSTYSVGSSIGSGTVLYNSGTDGNGFFQHMVPAGSTNYYYAYSFEDDNDMYSDPIARIVQLPIYDSGYTYAVESFSYTNALLSTSYSSGYVKGDRGYGWSGDWTEMWGALTNFYVDSGSFASQANYPQPGGNKVRRYGSSSSTYKIKRALSTTYSSGYFYFAFVMNYEYEGPDRWCGINFLNSSDTEKFFVGKKGGGDYYTFEAAGGSGGNLRGGTGNDYVILGIVNFSDGFVGACKYKIGADTVPTSQPGSWDASGNIGTGQNIQKLELVVGSSSGGNSCGAVYWDEIRVAGSWADLIKGDSQTPKIPPVPMLADAFETTEYLRVKVAGAYLEPVTNSGTTNVLYEVNDNIFSAGAGALPGDLQNPNFSDSAVSWTRTNESLNIAGWTNNAGDYTYDGAPLGSGGGLVFNAWDNRTGAFGEYYQDVYCDDGANVTFTARMVQEGNFTTTFFGLKMQFLDSGKNVLSTVSSSTGVNQTPQSISVNEANTPAGTAYVRCMIQMQGPPGPDTSGNGLLDGGFDASDFGSDTNAWWPSAGEAHFGANSGESSTPGVWYNFDHLPLAGHVLQDVAVDPGDQVEFSVRLHTDNTGGIDFFGVEIEFWNAAKTTQLGTTVATAYDYSTQWKTVSTGVQDVPAGAAWARCKIRVQDDSNPTIQNYAHADNAVFTFVSGGEGNLENRFGYVDSCGLTGAGVAGGAVNSSLAFILNAYAPVIGLSRNTSGSVDENSNLDVTNAFAKLVENNLSAYNSGWSSAFGDTKYDWASNTWYWSSLANTDFAKLQQGNYNSGDNDTGAENQDARVTNRITFTAWSANALNRKSLVDQQFGFFSIVDDDVDPPSASWVYLGTNWTGDKTSVDINNPKHYLTDGELLNGPVDFAYALRDSSGIFLTNTAKTGANPVTNVFQYSGGKSRHVCPNFDLTNEVYGNLGYDAIHGKEQLLGVNGATVATCVWQDVQFTRTPVAKTNIQLNVPWTLTVSAEDTDNDRGAYTDVDTTTYTDANVPQDRSVVVNQELTFYVVDDDTNGPGFTRISGLSKSDAQMRQGGWSFNVNARDSFSGLNRGDGNAESPTNRSPTFSLFSPEDVPVVVNELFTNYPAIALDGTSGRDGDFLLNSGPIPAADYTNLTLGTYSISSSAADGDWDRSDIDGANVDAAATMHSNVAALTVYDDDGAKPIFTEFTVNGDGGKGSTNLMAGGIAIVGVNGAPAGTDKECFSFVVLSPFPEGTRIDFTDCGWTNGAAGTWHRTSEFHTNKWVATGDADVGQVFKLNLQDINNDGDQVVVYQYNGAGNPSNDSANCRFISAINMDAEANGWDPDNNVPNDNRHSGLYRGLTNSATAVSVPNCTTSVNVRYIGPTNGTASYLLRQINDSNNWQVLASSTTYDITNIRFTVTGSGDMEWTVPTITDGQLAQGGYQITNTVIDTGSGLLATNNAFGGAPYYVLYNTNSGVVTSNAFTVGFTNGANTFQSMTLTGPGGTFDEITLGVVSARVVVTDFDDDRPSDSMTESLAINIHIEDDDTDYPEAGAGMVSVFTGNSALSPMVVTQLVAGWNFNAQSVAVSHGSGVFSSNVCNSVAMGDAGTTINAYSDDAAGYQATISGRTNIGQWIQFQGSMVGYQDLIVSFSARRTAIGYNSNNIAYSIDGGAFVEVETGWAPETSHTLKTVDLRSVDAMDNATSVAVRIVFGTNGVAGTGDNNYDNVQFNATPLRYFELTDAALRGVSAANPLWFSFNAYDTGSGLARGASGSSNSSLTIDGILTNDVSWYSAARSSAAAATTNATATNAWVIATDTFFTYGNVSSMYGDGESNRPICGVMADADFDRRDDSLIVSNVAFGYLRITDDDTNPPSPSVINAYAGRTGIDASFIVVTNGGVPYSTDSIRGNYSRRSGTDTNASWALSDYDLVNAGALNIRFVFGMLDASSGVRRGASGVGKRASAPGTNAVMSFSVTNFISGNYANYESTLSGAVTNKLMTNVWTFANGFFTEAMITGMMAATASGDLKVTVTAPDADDDRTNDEAVAYAKQIGFLQVYDDDANGPTMGAVQMPGVTGGNALFTDSFEPNQGWTNMATGYGSENGWTNDFVTSGTWIARGVLHTSFEPKNSGTRRLGFMTNTFDNPWMQMPQVSNPGTVFLYARSVSSGIGTALLRCVSSTNGDVWTSHGDLPVTNTAAFDLLSWNLDSTANAVTLRVVRVDVGPAVSRSQVYADDFSVTRRTGWTKQTNLQVNWTAAVDDYSGVDEYRYLPPTETNTVPRATNDGFGINIATTRSMVVTRQGTMTGFVFAVDNDNDRNADRAVGAPAPFMARVDWTPPTNVTRVVANEGFDPMTEIDIGWAPPVDGGGVPGNPLSPWQTYRLYYTDDQSTPTTNSEFFSSSNYASLASLNTSNAVISNLMFGTEYNVAVVGMDEAGNQGPISPPVNFFMAGFNVTQGLAIATQTVPQADISWTVATNQSGGITREYDLIWADGYDFSESLTSQWSLIRSDQARTLSDTGGVGRVNPASLVDQMRFYRASPKSRWLFNTNQTRRIASEEVYVLKTIRLHPGRNWIAFPGIPDTATVARVFGYKLPRGSSVLDATKIEWYSQTNNAIATNVIFLSASPIQWQDSGNNNADNRIVPIREGVQISIPTNSTATNIIMFIGEVPTTNNPSAHAIVGGTRSSPAINLVSYGVPYRLHPSQMKLIEAGFKGNARYTLSDRLFKYDRVSQRIYGAGLWYKTTDSTWREATSSTGPIVYGPYFSPDDGMVIYSVSTNNWVWTNHPPYRTPTRYMDP